MKPKDSEVIYKFTVAPAVPFPSALNWNIEPIGELIRCRDCKHHKGYNCDRLYGFQDAFTVKDEDFCSWAEKEEG